MIQRQYVITATRKKEGVNVAEDEPGLTPGGAGAPSLTPSRVNRTELDVWTLAVRLDEHEKVVGAVERVMVDSGAAVSACPSRHAPEIPMSNHSRRSVLGSARAQIQRAGQKTTEYENGDGGSVNINFKVADVITPLVAVGELQRRGITVVIGPHQSFVTRSQVTRSPGRNPNFEHCNGAYWMSLTRWENVTKTVAPVDLGDPVPTSKSLRMSSRQSKIRSTL